MNWIHYLLEANLYLSIFYIFYRLMLHKETFYVANRFYLLGAVALAFTLPFLQIGFFSNNVIQVQQFYKDQVEVQTSFFNLENILLLAYGLVAILLFGKLLFSFKKIISLIKKSNLKQENNVRIVELSHSNAAFSFFNLLFIDPKLADKNLVIKHEMVHINQKHSFDVLFFELIQIVNWFNPVIYYLKKDIKLLHEYLADEATTNRDIQKYEYAMFLIQNTCNKQNLLLTNQIFNSSILKQRINMLNQQKSAKWARLKLLVTLPLAGAMVCVSTMAFTKNYGVLDLYPKTNVGKFNPKQTTPKKAKAKEIAIAEPVKELPPPPPIEPTPVKSKTSKKGMVPPPPPKAPAVKSKVAPPPPPIEPKPAKGEVLEIKLSPPPPPVEPKPAKKQ